MNGMIDGKTHTYPDIIKMLQTCKQEVKQDQVDLVFKHFSTLYSIMKEEGHITEEVYDRLGFDPDTNYTGDTVSKPDEISNEMRHRAKVLRYRSTTPTHTLTTASISSPLTNHRPD